MAKPITANKSTKERIMTKMLYYGIYFFNEYKVVKRTTPMINNREWLKKEYGNKAKAFQKISKIQYYFYKFFKKALDK